MAPILKVPLVLLSCTLIINSCIVANKTKFRTEDGVKKTPKECSLHKKEMHKHLVGTIYGLTAFEFIGTDYPNARRKASMGCIIQTWPIRRLAIIYVCSECNKARKLDDVK